MDSIKKYCDFVRTSSFRFSRNAGNETYSYDNGRLGRD